MMNLTHDWFYKAFISVKVFLNNFSYFAILSCSFTSKTKKKAFCGIYASAAANFNLNSKTKWNIPLFWAKVAPTHGLNLVYYRKINITLFNQYST